MPSIKNNKAKSNKIINPKNQALKKRILLTVIVFAVVGTAFLIRSFAATSVGNLSQNTAVRVNVKSGECETSGAGCTEMYYNQYGEDIFNVQNSTIKPSASLKDMTLDTGLEQSVCIRLRGFGESGNISNNTPAVTFQGDGGRVTFSGDTFAGSSDGSSQILTKCALVEGRFSKVPSVTINGSAHIFNYSVNYLPGYTIGPTYGSFSVVSAKANPGETRRTCGISSEVGGPDYFSGTKFYQERYYVLNCSKSNVVSGAISDFKALTAGATYKLCIRASGQTGTGVVSLLSERGDFVKALTLDGNSDGWKSYCSSDFVADSSVLGQILNNSILYKVYYDAAKGSTVNFTQIYLARKLD